MGQATPSPPPKLPAWFCQALNWVRSLFGRGTADFGPYQCEKMMGEISKKMQDEKKG
jgi:hypothetical protein